MRGFVASCTCLVVAALAIAGGSAQTIARPFQAQLPEMAQTVVAPYPGKAVVVGDAPSIDPTRVTILWEGFEGVFPGSWQLLDDPTWRDLPHRAHGGSWAAYCAGGGALKVAPPGPYPPSWEAWMIYGPFDLSDAVEAHLGFWLWRDMAAGDLVGWAGSPDGANFYGWQIGGSADWTNCPASLPEVDLSGRLGDDSVWIGFRTISDASTEAEGAWVDDVEVYKRRALLEWAGTTGYGGDGVDPNGGDPIGYPSPTTFTFKVKYTDPTGNPPSRARCIIQRLHCRPWEALANLGMTLESGTIATGAIFSVSAQLPCEVLKYRFLFQASNGVQAVGTPNVYVQGPGLAGPPKLCWYGKGGFVSDGVHPDSGSTGTKFKFMVLYQSSYGMNPTTAKVVLRRNGVLYKQRTMSTYSGDYRIGKPYVTTMFIYLPGAYDYRFEFYDGPMAATGDPANWTSGPTITSPTSVQLTSVAAVPSPAGAQLAFTLSADADVTATVLNVAGRPVRALISDRPLAAGLNALLWNGRSDCGLRAPPGLYVVRVLARGADGAQANSVATLALR